VLIEKYSESIQMIVVVFLHFESPSEASGEITGTRFLLRAANRAFYWVGAISQLLRRPFFDQPQDIVSI
jgi:hypothetical protein